ncbi:hypothetical protein [Kushneria indalinina]|uniref:Uncharacterized protein n=1 Tax=Kushneria indalinina DSM 14324 TaxID=1122140 RepID=A0A3D9DZ62_9GAMM|nr:hypothetical protein [Kushneria indalinina]REC95991.1 hypothetical protein C8D72_0660 [Kushneria indalinina DSM 14324]
MTSARYPEHHTPCQPWASRWVESSLACPDEAWNTFDSAHRTAFIILRVTRPEMGEEILIDSLIQAQMVS